MEDINRIPPHSVESEQSILGSIILDNESMLKLNSNNEPIDLITLIEE